MHPPDTTTYTLHKPTCSVSGKLFYVIYSVVAFFILVNMFISLLNNSYSLVSTSALSHVPALLEVLRSNLVVIQIHYKRYRS